MHWKMSIPNTNCKRQHSVKVWQHSQNKLRNYFNNSQKQPFVYESLTPIKPKCLFMVTQGQNFFLKLNTKCIHLCTMYVQREYKSKNAIHHYNPKHLQGVLRSVIMLFWSTLRTAMDSTLQRDKPYAQFLASKNAMQLCPTPTVTERRQCP